MQSGCLREVAKVCLEGCGKSMFFALADPHKPIPKSKSTSSTCRHNFATTTSSIFSNSQFTNHESLPSMNAAFTEFIKAYPKYFETGQIDRIRAQEYYHLSDSNHTCLDYIGIGLFSHSQLQAHDSTTLSVSSSASLEFPLFSISYKAGDLKTQLLHGGQESDLESAMKRRIMSFLNVSENDYSMVFTANKTSAFKLLAESYPFQSSRKLLTVYDYESEAVDAMISTSEKRGARVMSAEFSWPRLRIHSAKLKKMVMSKRKKKKKKKRGLFVFPLHSRITGTRYPYLWMSIAQENGWHVLVDACALGSKDMDSFGLSLFLPDFLVCSFYKVFGENPSGFGCLFVKKSTISILESSTNSVTVGLFPAKTDTQLNQTSEFKLDLPETKLSTSNSFSEPISIETEQVAKEITANSSETSENHSRLQIECRALDQVDSMGLVMINNRSRYLINWLVNAFSKLQHPNTEGISPLIRIYGPKVRFDRGPALAFNLFDWKGEKVKPVLVQKLADRSNISLSYGLLNHIWFPEKYEEDKGKFLEKRSNEESENGTKHRKAKSEHGITVVTAALGFVANFEDVYRIWAFVAQFLDADFVEKERWRYTALNQTTIEI